MKPELEKILIEKYPKLLRDCYGDPRTTCMSFGIETDSGWFQLIDHLFSYLTNLMSTPLNIDYTKEYKEKHKGEKDYYEKHYTYKFKPPQIILDQIKSKYATLRAYYHTDLEEEIPEDVWAVLDLDDYYKKLERYNQKIDFAIDYAEYLSSITCEVTGKPGKLYTKGWHVVLCDEEAIKKGYKVEEGSTEGIKVEEL